jgi:hypothetical protein
MKKPRFIIPLMIATLAFSCTSRTEEKTAERWTSEKAWEWYDAQDWLTGANFVPSTAINQLEMWQAETFDPETIDRELGYAEGIGFNIMRVFLHHIVWQQDPEAYLERIGRYLEISSGHGISTMFVFFDDVWNPRPKAGPQPEPYKNRHNSGWVQCPGVEILKDSNRHDEMESYVKGIMEHFSNDPRVLVWDLYNEPGNTSGGRFEGIELPEDEKRILSLSLLKKVFHWAREVNPSQPVTVGAWRDFAPEIKDMPALNRYSLEHSDIITYHNYTDIEGMKRMVSILEKPGRPMICTEYMARTVNNTFQIMLPYMKEKNIGAINWGLVDGKSQTKFAWDSWYEEFPDEPDPWFHDIFRVDGTPYDPEETDLIRSLNED